jgi:phosphate transport system permease protein
MSAIREVFRRGDPGIWLTGTGLGISVLMIAGMVGLILTNGLGFFWPRPIARVTLKDQRVLMGEIAGREGIPAPGMIENLTRFRIQLKLGNRDLAGADYAWVNEDDIARTEYPPDALYVERREYGPFIGRATRIVDGDRTIATGSDAVLAALPALVAKAASDRAAIRVLENRDIGVVNYRIERTRLAGRTLDLEARQHPGADLRERREALEKELAALKARYAGFEDALTRDVEAASRVRVILQAADGTEKALPVIDVFRAYPANQLTTAGVQLRAAGCGSSCPAIPANRIRKAECSRPSSVP